MQAGGPDRALSNAEIADRLASLAQLLAAEKENPFKVKAYQRAAARIRTYSQSIHELVKEDADLTAFPGIGEAIAGAIREIVDTGTLNKLEKLRAGATPELAGISRHPRLDPQRVMRIYRKLRIASIQELRERLDNGEIEQKFGPRMAQHVRQGLTDAHAMLLYRADDLRVSIEEYLLSRCGVLRVQAAGAYRRRLEVVDELVFVAEAPDFPAVLERLQRFGGRTPVVAASAREAVLELSAGIQLHVHSATRDAWGTALVRCTGSAAHLRKLEDITGSLHSLPDAPTEAALYGRFSLDYIAPELREGRDEIERAASGSLPVLVTAKDIRGELHAHSTSSDGGDSIEAMAEAARARNYEYIGITDHSQSLKIARGVSVADLWAQIRVIDRLNERATGFRILKSAEVDILAGGALDYPDELLRELDYTVCSIHSRFSLDKAAQTERLLRAMDNRYFNILGHATGRLLLKRPGYEIDMERVIAHARQNGCFFEINSSADRLDLSAENARSALQAGVRIAISTDAHSTPELRLIRCGIDQARRAGAQASSILNCLPWTELQPLMRR